MGGDKHITPLLDAFVYEEEDASTTMFLVLGYCPLELNAYLRDSRAD